jgi:hypothetical protein
MPEKGENTMPKPAEPVIISQGADNLAAALQECRAAALRGYELAKQSLNQTSKAIDQLSQDLSKCLEEIEDGLVRTPEVTDELRKQLTQVVDDLKKQQHETEQAVEGRRRRFDRFSVTLFGRTMAGKSTLMEILTRGDGCSIGTGAQRTTRDVRSYYWKGLEVTDVPGVAAFGGEEDERIAFAAASQADMVLFMITDDAPQAAEAECLARIRELGKPVLGICNVKAAIDDEDDLLLFLRTPERCFEPSRINTLLDQFHAFVALLFPGMRIDFVPTHLRARFLAERGGYEKYREKLRQASRFDAVESRIVREVTGRGAFLRVKSFVDAAAVPTMKLADRLFEYCQENSRHGRVYIDKRRQLRDWRLRFKEHGRQRIEDVVAAFANELRAAVPEFTEAHCEDESAGRSWRRLVESSGAGRRIETLQRELAEECRSRINEMARELKEALSRFSGEAADDRLRMEKISDYKRVWNWGVMGVTGGLTIAGLFVLSGPLGWAAAAVSLAGSLLSGIFDDRGEKLRSARAKLSGQLYADIERMEKDLRGRLTDWFFGVLLKNQVDVLLNDLDAVTGALFKLADSQRLLAWSLDDRQKDLARMIVGEALRHMGCERIMDLFRGMARIPGVSTMLLIEPGTRVPRDARERLERLLGEKILFAVDTKNAVSLIGQAVGPECDRKNINIEKKIRVAHLNHEHIGPQTRSRIRLARQLTGLHVVP